MGTEVWAEMFYLFNCRLRELHNTWDMDRDVDEDRQLSALLLMFGLNKMSGMADTYDAYENYVNECASYGEEVEISYEDWLLYNSPEEDLWEM